TFGHVLLAEEQHHAVLARPPFQRAEVAPGKVAAARGGDDALGGYVPADAGGLSPRSGSSSRRGKWPPPCPTTGTVGRRCAWDGKRRRCPSADVEAWPSGFRGTDAAGARRGF